MSNLFERPSNASVDARAPPLRRAVESSERPDRQQAILLAAEKLFAQHGYRTVSFRGTGPFTATRLVILGLLLLLPQMALVLLK